MCYVLRRRKKSVNYVAWQMIDAAGAVGVGAEMRIDFSLLKIFG